MGRVNSGGVWVQRLGRAAVRGGLFNAGSLGSINNIYWQNRAARTFDHRRYPRIHQRQELVTPYHITSLAEAV